VSIMETRLESYGLASRLGAVRGSDVLGRAHLIDEDSVVGVGEYKVARGPSKLMCIGLGSCVGIAIFDLQAKVGGVAHAMLPRYEEGRDKINATKYADSAIMIMVDELLEMGASRGHLRAKMAGGAQMFSFISSDTLNIGLKNSESARATLRGENIPLLAEDVGGTRGRTITFNLENGVYRIQKGNDMSSI